MNDNSRYDVFFTSLSALHDQVNSRHEESRQRVLAAIENEKPAVRRKQPHWRIAAGALSAAASLMLLVWLASPPSAAVAMEQLAEALEQVTEYAYEMESISVSSQADARTVRQVTKGRWRNEPVALYASIKIDEALGPQSRPWEKSKVLVQLEELHQHGKQGLLVDHLKQEFWTIDSEIDANAIPPGSPQVAVYMVQSRQGRVVRDLGRKRLDGKLARGLGFVLDNTRPKSELGPVSFLEDDEWKWKDVEFEVWVNEKTNLPIEFRAVRKTPHAEISYRFHNLIWNETQRFELEAPAGYQELEKTDE